MRVKGVGGGEGIKTNKQKQEQLKGQAKELSAMPQMPSIRIK